MHVNRSFLGWGAFLIIVGAIPLLVRSGSLSKELIAGWPALWPILLIGWGIGLLLRRTPGEVIGSAVTVVVLGIMGGGLIATGFGGVPAFGGCGEEARKPFSGASGTLADGADISIEFNCGDLNVTAVDGTDWTLSGSSPDGKAPSVDADEQGVRIRAADSGFVDAAGTWDVAVPRATTRSLGLTLNAGDGTVDLGASAVQDVSSTLNAGQLRLGLADAAELASLSGTVNAGSATYDLPATLDSASLSLNAGSMTVCVPDGTPIRVSWGGALGSNNLDDAGLVEGDDNHWTTPGFSEASDHLELSVSANAGSFTLDLGGACDA